MNNKGLVSILTVLALAAGVAFLVLRSERARGDVSHPSPMATQNQVSGSHSSLHRMAIPVVATQAKLGDLPHYLSAIGTVTPISTVTVQSRVAGQIMEVNFREGEIVTQGQMLVQIDPRPYQVQLEQAQGQLAHDVAALRNDTLNLERDRTLYGQNVIARQTLDTQQATVRQDRGTLMTDKANVDNAKLQLTYSRITAPISGRIGLRLVDPGNIIQANSTQGIAVITQLQPITVVFSIPEDSLELVLAAMKAGKVPAEAYDRSFRNQLASGALLTMDNQIDTNTGTVKLKAEFSNQQQTLFPNQFVNVRMLAQTLHDQVLIPLAAIQRSSLGTFVYVVRADQTVELRKIQEGLTEGDTASVRSGLASGETVVTNGVDRLQQGSPVTVQSATSKTPLAVNVAQ
ncbi:MAG: MdtA/MuxA family multidrug efflux RND transporter periplasmic adaptor subunit [Deltaproteobacteria bacterium]|nr:MdtA/MuxA family multidrug efflux RND transporter periplasmic adaptor subunit [Deltaproteobacteria bacterium]